MVKAGLQQLRQVVVLGRADQPGDVEAGERAGAGVEVAEQNAERLAIELDDRELSYQKIILVTCLSSYIRCHFTTVN